MLHFQHQFQFNYHYKLEMQMISHAFVKIYDFIIQDFYISYLMVVQLCYFPKVMKKMMLDSVLVQSQVFCYAFYIYYRYNSNQFHLVVLSQIHFYNIIGNIIMLEDKLPQLIRLTYNIKTLVVASYKAKQSLAAKGLTPAIFLDPFYRNRDRGNQQITYNLKQKQIKPLPQYITIDVDDYSLIRKQDKNSMDDIDESLLSNKLLEMLGEQKIKYLRETDKNIFQDRGQIQKFINNQSFHWFQKANKMYCHALTMGQDNYRVNTSDQPMAVCYILQVQKQKSVKQIFDKMRTQVDYLTRRIFELNPDQIPNVKPMIIILYDISRGSTIQQSLDYTSYFKNNSSIHSSFILRIGINGQDQADLTTWSHFNRPILHYNYNIKISDPIRIISQDQYRKVQQTIDHHKQTIRRAFQARIQDLFKKYQQVNKASNKLMNFFRGNTPNDRTYTKQQLQLRQLADKMFMIQDYKRAYQIYKNLSDKMQKRNPSIQNNLAQMIHLCLAISKYHNIKLKSDPYSQIQRNADRVLKFYENKSKLRLKKYLIFLTYCFHTFRTFNRQFIRQNYYVNLKATFSNHLNLNVISVLLYEQFANMNLFYKNIDYRKYAYDITRVASRFTQTKMNAYALRCFLVVEALYRDTFPNIQKYQYTQLGHLFLQNKNYRQSLKNLKMCWQVYLTRMQTQDLLKNQQQLTKLIQNFTRMVRQIQRQKPQQLQYITAPNLEIPIIHSLNLQIKDQMLDYDEKSGKKWQEIGETILDNKQLMSIGLNQRQFRNLFKSFDYGVPQQKYLIHKFTSSILNQMVIKKNSRNAYVGQPIKLSFYMRNPLRADIDIQNICLKIKQNIQQISIKIQKNNILIKSFKSQQVIFTITPLSPGFLQLQSIQWIFMKLLTQYHIKQPIQFKSNIKNCYFKLNILPSLGCLESKAYFQDYYYQGQHSKMKLFVKNTGVQKITKIYIASGQSQMFGCNIKQINLQLLPNTSQQLYFDIFVPLVNDNIQSGQQKRICKLLILYKTGDKYRVARTINKFNILRIAKIQNIICQRLSTHLHLLSFSKKKIGNKEDSCGLEWMIIPPGFDIVKKQAADLVTQTNYFFFIRRGQYSLSKFQFQNWVQDISLYPQQFLKIYNPQNAVNIRFLWRKEQKIGYISKYNIPIQINQHGYLSTIFPISFKINYQKQQTHNFLKKPYLQIPISIKLKNILCNDQLKIAVNFTDSAQSDSSWQGTTQRKLLLKMGAQSIINIKYVVVRPGIYILSNQIKYNIINTKGQYVNIVHSDYQKIYLTIKGQNTQQNNKNDFDPFKEFISMQFEQKTMQIKIDNQSLI